jgi:hypothetical protein
MREGVEGKDRRKREGGMEGKEGMVRVTETV